MWSYLFLESLSFKWASPVAQLVKNPPVMWETWIQSLDWEDPLKKVTGTRSSILSWRSPWTIQSMGLQSWTQLSDFHYILNTKMFEASQWLSGKESACNARDGDSIPGSGRTPGGGNGNPFQYSSLENSHGQRSLRGNCPWGHKESDMTEVTQ